MTDSLALPLVLDGLSLRAQQPQDDAFLLQLLSAHRAPALLAAGMPENVLAMLLPMQCQAQEQDMVQRYPQAKRAILHQGTQSLGRVAWDQNPQRLHLIDIAVLPTFQHQGWATQVLRRLQAAAAQRAMPLTLWVAPDNPALGWYTRWGFSVVQSTESQRLMQWRGTNLGVANDA